jgi:hypothetical protein
LQIAIGYCCLLPGTDLLGPFDTLPRLRIALKRYGILWFTNDPSVVLLPCGRDCPYLPIALKRCLFSLTTPGPFLNLPAGLRRSLRLAPVAEISRSRFPSGPLTDLPDMLGARSILPDLIASLIDASTCFLTDPELPVAASIAIPALIDPIGKALAIRPNSADVRGGLTKSPGGKAVVIGDAPPVLRNMDPVG